MRKFETIRQEIKKLSEEQKYYKPLRKPSVALLDPKFDKSLSASREVQHNKYVLRHLFQAYAILRGKDRPVVKKPSLYNGVIINESLVNELVEKFKPSLVEN